MRTRSKWRPFHSNERPSGADTELRSVAFSQRWLRSGGIHPNCAFMLEIKADWSAEQERDGELLAVRCNLLPRSNAKHEEEEVLIESRQFLLQLLRDFAARDGVAHVHTNEAFGAIHGWPRTLTNASQVDDAIAQLVEAHRQREFYPVVIWFETSRVSKSHAITASNRAAAAKDMDLLHELLRAGMARLFLDEQFADLLAHPTCRFMIRTYVTRAAARSQNIVTDFDYS